MTEEDLIDAGWRKVDSRWFKNGAIICQRNRRGPAGMTFDDAVKIEKLIEEWGKE